MKSLEREKLDQAVNGHTPPNNAPKRVLEVIEEVLPRIVSARVEWTVRAILVSLSPPPNAAHRDRLSWSPQVAMADPENQETGAAAILTLAGT